MTEDEALEIYRRFAAWAWGDGTPPAAHRLDRAAATLQPIHD
ncbi:hypothetical protein [Bordetella genomosp. 13]|nr:hypothetical protein [Bordetella genomosp. 13]